MKKMSLKTARKVVSRMCIAMAPLIVLCLLTEGTVELIFACLILADMIAIPVIAYIFQRCPHCGHLMRDYGKFCPGCGKELDW